MSQPAILRRNVLTRDTAHLLIQIAERDLHNTQILLKAREIIRHVYPRDYLSQSIACLYWVRQHVTFVKDPEGIELVLGPAQLLKLIERYGRFAEDCDSQSALLYTLLRAIGHRPALSFVGYSKSSKIDHVFVEDPLFGEDLALDPILPAPFVHKALKKIAWKETLTR